MSKLKYRYQVKLIHSGGSSTIKIYRTKRFEFDLKNTNILAQRIANTHNYNNVKIISVDLERVA